MYTIVYFYHLVKYCVFSEMYHDLHLLRNEKLERLSVKKMAMFAARNLSSVKEPLLPTGKLRRAQQSMKTQRIMPW